MKRCQNCGAEFSQTAQFCPSCGAAVEQAAGAALSQEEAVEKEKPDALSWSIAVPIFKHSVVLKQLGLAIGIPFGILAIVLAVIARKEIYALYGLGLIGALFLFTWLFLLAVYRGKYDMEFVLDDRGALYRTEARQAEKNRVINALAVIAGVLSGKPVAAGAGILAQSRQEVFLSWPRLTRVRYKPRSYTILLRSSPIDNFALFCSEENYAAVEGYVKSKTRHLES